MKPPRTLLPGLTGQGLFGFCSVSLAWWPLAVWYVSPTAKPGDFQANVPPGGMTGERTGASSKTICCGWPDRLVQVMGSVTSAKQPLRGQIAALHDDNGLSGVIGDVDRPARHFHRHGRRRIGRAQLPGPELDLRSDEPTHRRGRRGRVEPGAVVDGGTLDVVLVARAAFEAQPAARRTRTPRGRRDDRPVVRPTAGRAR